MRGRIVSLVEHYGFIKADDESYYFNKRAMAAGQDYAELSKGDFVSFEPAASPKGMTAKNITRVEVSYCWLPATKMIVSHKPCTEIMGDLSYELRSVTGVWDRSGPAAKEMLIASLKNVGVNCITDLKMKSVEMRDGNYVYSLRTWSCMAGAYFESVPVEDSLDHDQQIEANLQMSADVLKAVEAIDDNNNVLRDKETRVSPWALLWIPVTICVFIVGIILAMLGARRR